VHEAQIFVAVLGASSYTYAEATWTQQLPDWIGSHVRTFAYLGGVPEIVVPDNTRCAVTDPHLYEPDLNPTYQDLATHYDVAVMPARPRRPRDKAKVEAGVLLVERWILAALRNRRFFSLVELNEASPSGARSDPGSTITSTSTATTTRFPTRSPGASSRRVSPCAAWRSSIEVSAWPATVARRRRDASRPFPSTCRRTTGTRPSGRLSA
jgi:hypothetical protein